MPPVKKTKKRWPRTKEYQSVNRHTADPTHPLYRWFQQSNMSGAELCRAIGIPLQTLYWWMSGNAAPRVIYALRVALITNNGVPVESWLETKAGREIWQRLARQSAALNKKLIEKHVTNG